MELQLEASRQQAAHRMRQLLQRLSWVVGLVSRESWHWHNVWRQQGISDGHGSQYY